LPEGATLSDFVNVTVLLVDKPASLWLPPQAVRVFEGREYVITKDGESQHRVDILTGLRTAERVEILEGLEEGMQVVGP
jgi:multidrug efflux pump subunit AcrA (membrane-fusion protein)